MSGRRGRGSRARGGSGSAFVGASTPSSAPAVSLRRSHFSSFSNGRTVSANAKYAGPSDREAVDLLDPPLHRDAPVARGQLTDPLLGSFESLRSDRHADPAVPVAEELEPQQGPFDRWGDRRLLSVDAQLQALLDVVRDALHDALSRALAADVDTSVVSEAHEPMTAAIELPVEVVEHDVR